MPTLHGSWILQQENSYFFVWGETWKSGVSVESATDEIPVHPFVCDREELISCLQDNNLLDISGDGFTLPSRDRLEKKWQTQIINLPSQKATKTKTSLPILSGNLLTEEINSKSLVLNYWQVSGLAFEAIDLVNFLSKLPIDLLQERKHLLGAELYFWAQVYRWSLDLIARHKFLPGVLRISKEDIQSIWQPLLDSNKDQTRFAKFSQSMPPACYVDRSERETEEQFKINIELAQQVLLNFLTVIVDSQLRSYLDIKLDSYKAQTLQPWLQSLLEEKASFSSNEKEYQRLETALDRWTLPIQEYLVGSPNNKLGQKLFRTCVILQPPKQTNTDEAQSNWFLKYSLQALDDSEFLVDAATIWQHPDEHLVIQTKAIEQPQETLLKGLGLASRLYAPIANSLQASKPTECELNPIEVYEFIRSIAWQLQDSGLGVVLPPGLASDTQESRLGIKINAEISSKKGERLNLKSLLEYKLEIAIGEQTVSKKEFERLLAQKSPFVEVNGQWLALQPADVRSAQAVLNKSNEAISLSVEDALRLSTGDTKTLAKLPVVSFEASGILQELINNLTDNKSVQAVQKPKDFVGELRPYQAKGVGWLAFLEQWGLGACLADDMGLGKCISADSQVYINGNSIAAEKIWEIYSGKIEFDGEGYWSEPIDKLLVDSLDEYTNNIVQCPIQKLYRQQVREKLRKITLQDGNSITITKIHKLLTNNGWTNNLQVGDYVCVPAKTIAKGQLEEKYRQQKRSKWTTPTLEKYLQLDKVKLELTREKLQGLVDKEVFYCPIKSIEEIDYDGWVYDFEISQHHNFVANNIICHNTIQTIAFLLNLKEQKLFNKTVLLVCPTSVLNNWEREVKKFAPTLSTLIHHGDKRDKGKDFTKAIKNKSLVITSYSLIYRDAKTLEEIDWQGIILDEAQNIKNPAAKQSQAVRKLKAGFRISLTGTPVENRLSDLWSIIDFINPGFLGTSQFFQKRFAIPIEKYGDRDSLQTLRSLVQPFILRRLKTDKDIIQDLPEKQEMNVFCGLSKQQAEIYQELTEKSLKEIESSEGIKRRGLILTLILRLKQLCNHPELVKSKNVETRNFASPQNENFSDRSGKLLRLEEMLEEIIAEDDRALIFTQFAEWGELLKPYLEKKLATEVLFLYGATSRQQRQEMVDRFQNDPNGPRIFILSLKAGGTGLNLTRATHVFHVDRWWNPAVENQATDRAFRIGQKRNVQVHKFVCTGTLEEKINDTIEQKKELAEQTVDSGEQWLTELDTDQLRNLLLLDRNAVIDEE
ncbi:MAG: SNF2-related protein [Xenococcaceae cyanobacterium]